MAATIAGLAWVLGDGESMQPFVDRLARDVREYLAEEAS